MTHRTRPSHEGSRAARRGGVALAVAAGLLVPVAGAAHPAQPPGTGWTAPVVPTRVLRSFTLGPDPWSPGHRGVDLAAPPAASVRSPAAGRVSFAGVVAGTPVVVVAHPGGLRSTFVPTVGVLARGDAVAAGQVVARLAPGPGHCPGTTCLHWGVLRGELYLDPLALLGARRIVLLPLGPAVTGVRAPAGPGVPYAGGLGWRPR